MPTVYPIIKGNQYFDATLYTGTNTTNVISNSGGMQPDFVWIKNRNSDQSHTLVDVLRGTTKQLNSNDTAAEGTNSAGRGLQSFNSNGFTLGIESSATGGTNASGFTYVGWQWKANGTGVSNTTGTITSTVSASTTAGFSIVTWTGNATNNSSVGHGLSTAPAIVIIKNRADATTWYVKGNPSKIPAFTNENQYLYLNLTNSIGTSSFNETTLTSSLIQFPVAGNDTNGSGKAMVAYCWAEVPGFSKFGSYTGNGNADGTFVYTGFRPAYVVYKRSDSTGGWNILDETRNPYNVVGEYINANLDSAEANATIMDILSNGFKMRNTFSSANASGGTYVYMAFAEMPTKYANAR
jgi:hypothetical protein